MPQRLHALLTAVLLAAVAAGSLGATDQGPLDELLVRQANRILEDLEPYLGDNELPYISDVPVAPKALEMPYSGTQEEEEEEEDVIDVVLRLLGVDEPEPDCIEGTTWAGGSSVNAFVVTTHQSTVPISWCWHPPNINAERAGYYESFTVHPATVSIQSPIVHYLMPDAQNINGGTGANHVEGTVTVRFCTGVRFQGDYTCVDHPNHEYLIGEHGPGDPYIEFASVHSGPVGLQARIDQ